MKRLHISILSIAIILAACDGKNEGGGEMPWGNIDGETSQGAGYEVGAVLPAWEKGYLDIHAINSGRGECIFYILPDGTTMLVDAGEVTSAGDAYIQRKPNEATRPYVTYARYIQHFLPKGYSSLDYMYLTHFHIDHMGEYSSSYPLADGGYRASGLMALYDEVPFNKLLDRGYPNYGEDTSILPPESSATDNYISFVKYATAKKGLKAERIIVGSDNQVKQIHDPDTYKCTVLNIVGNGSYVMKDDNGKVVDKVSITAENAACCGFHLKYGLFDYVACADLTSGPQNRMAQYYQDFINVLEVFKANHHLSANSWGSQMQAVSFSPRVIINESFSDYQPDPDLLGCILSGKFEKNTVNWNKDIFLTNAHENALAKYPELFAKCHYNGHVVIRVSPGGGQFYVYMLDDSDFQYRIKSVHGPYSSK